MRNSHLPALTAVNTSTDDSIRKSIHVLFTQGDVEPVIQWLKRRSTAPNDSLLSYIWMKSIRSNLTEPIAAYLNDVYPGKIGTFNASLNMTKLLHSPRAWSSLKTQKLIPKLSPQEIFQITEAWNTNLLAMANNFYNQDNERKMEPYFKECAKIQIDFLEHFVPSYKEKMSLLLIGLIQRSYAPHLCTIENFGKRNAMTAIDTERAYAMADSTNPDMWMLASMEAKHVVVSYYVSYSKKLSNWWMPLLSELHPKAFDVNHWDSHFSTATSEKQLAPDKIVVAYDLTVCAYGIDTQLKTWLAMADAADGLEYDTIDLAAIGLDIE